MWDKPALMNAVANALFSAAALLVLAAVVTQVARLPAFSLREVRVGGEMKHVTRDQVETLLKGGTERARQHCAAEVAKGNHHPGCPVQSKYY